jgi:hypothetical protein
MHGRLCTCIAGDADEGTHGLQGEEGEHHHHELLISDLVSFDGCYQVDMGGRVLAWPCMRHAHAWWRPHGAFQRSMRAQRCMQRRAHSCNHAPQTIAKTTPPGGPSERRPTGGVPALPAFCARRPGAPGAQPGPARGRRGAPAARGGARAARSAAPAGEGGWGRGVTFSAVWMAVPHPRSQHVPSSSLMLVIFPTCPHHLPPRSTTAPCTSWSSGCRARSQSTRRRCRGTPRRAPRCRTRCRRRRPRRPRGGGLGPTGSCSVSRAR